MFLLVPAYPGSPGQKAVGQKAVKRLCVCGVCNPRDLYCVGYKENLKLIVVIIARVSGQTQDGSFFSEVEHVDSTLFSMQFCFMTALLVRWQVIPANSVVFCLSI